MAVIDIAIAATTATAQTTETVSYLDEDGNLHEVEATKLESDANKTLAAGWYYVENSSSVTVARSLTVNGAVNIIIKDNSTYKINNYTAISAGATLTLYAQSRGEGVGALRVQAIASGEPAVQGSGTLNIYGVAFDAYSEIVNYDYVVAQTITVNLIDGYSVYYYDNRTTNTGFVPYDQRESYLQNKTYKVKLVWCADHNLSDENSDVCSYCHSNVDFDYQIIEGTNNVQIGDGEHSAWKGAGTPSTITIPKTVKIGGTDYTVTKIADNSFNYFGNGTALTKVVFAEGNSITSIGENAFSNNKNLKSVNLEACTNLTTLGDGVFHNSFRDQNSSCSITIPAGVVEIPDNAFANCAYLTSVEFKGNVTKIGANAFFQSGLSAITLSEDIQSIGDYAFLDLNYTAGNGTFKITCNATQAPEIGSSILSPATSRNYLTIPNCGTGYSEWADYFDAANITGGVIIASTAISGIETTKEYDGTATLAIQGTSINYAEGNLSCTITPTMVTFLDQYSDQPSPSAGYGKKLQVAYSLSEITNEGETCTDLDDNTIILKNDYGNPIYGSITYTGDVYIPASGSNTATFYVGVHDDLNVLTNFSPALPSNVTVEYQYDNDKKQASYKVTTNNADAASYILSDDADDPTITINLHVAVPYAVYQDGTLTFKIGYKSTESVSPDNIYDIPTSGSPGWYSERENVSAVVFASSFANCRPKTCSEWFYEMTGLTSITGMKEYLNTESVTDMSNMFYNCRNLTSLDVSGFDTRNVTSMGGMFNNCRLIERLDVSGFDTENVTSMSSMFEDCRGLKSLDVSNFDTENVTNMAEMFRSCSSLTTLDVSNFKTGIVTNMSFMFGYCSGLESLSFDVNKFNTASVTSMEFMFGYCEKLESLDVSHFDTKNVTNMYYMFGKCKKLTSLDVSNFDMQNVTNMSFMFNECWGLTSLDVSGFNTGSATTMSNMFNECSKLENINVSRFSTDNVTNMSNMFRRCEKLSSLNVSNFNTFNVKNMEGMFCVCSSLTSLDVSGFATDNVTSMYGMFSGCSGLTSLNVSTFVAGSVTNITHMFYGCKGLTSLDLSNFNTASVEKTDYMFDECNNLTAILVGPNWDVTTSPNSSFMFSSTTELIGDKGTKYSSSKPIDKTYAHVDGGESDPGYLTSGKYKIFYDLNADDGEEKLETYTGAVEEYFDEKVTLVTPPAKPGYTFEYWTGTKITGLVDGTTATSVTIAKGEVGNRIYTAHWKAIPYSISLPDADWTATPTPATIGQTVTLTYNGTEKIKEVKVYPMPQSISITNTSVTLTAGGASEQLDYDIDPTTIADEDKVVTWSSDNTAVATVNNSGEVTPVAAGTANITATTTNGKTATIEITVN